MKLDYGGQLFKSVVWVQCVLRFCERIFLVLGSVYSVLMDKEPNVCHQFLVQNKKQCEYGERMMKYVGWNMKN